MDGRRSILQLLAAVVPTSGGDLHHLDVVVDGTSMQAIVGRTGVTILNRTWLGARPSPLDVLRGSAVDDLAGPGRLPLLACQECADLECGVLTAALEVGEHEVMWSDFRWVTSYDDDVALDELSPLRFDRRAYERELKQAAAVLPSLPSEVRRPARQRWWRR